MSIFRLFYDSSFYEDDVYKCSGTLIAFVTAGVWALQILSLKLLTVGDIDFLVFFIMIGLDIIPFISDSYWYRDSLLVFLAGEMDEKEKEAAETRPIEAKCYFCLLNCFSFYSLILFITGSLFFSVFSPSPDLNAVKALFGLLILILYGGRGFISLMVMSVCTIPYIKRYKLELKEQEEDRLNKLYGVKNSID